LDKPGFVDLRGLRRYLPAVGLALVLHVALLAPLRFSETGAATVAAPPSMVVRILAAHASAERLAPDVQAALQPVMPLPRVGETAPLGQSPATSRRPAAPDAADPVAAIDSSGIAKPVQRPPGLAPAPNYRNSGMLDPGPQPLHDITPEYPVRAGQQQGVVVLRLLINEQGLVDNVAVLRSEPKGFFEESALEAYGQARFSPGMLLGLPVKSQMLIEVVFATENRGASVSGRTY
jgi:protein TonB